MTVLYEDAHLVCDDDAITIKNYYLPFGAKRIPYRNIREVRERRMGLFTGRGRIWGATVPTEWFHLDMERPFKDRCIVLDVGRFVRPVVTPTDHDQVVSILRERVGRA